ncbi:hypothetical protein AVEN_181286-1 [Araneus ventricosus]|uniref:Uncharacterized protein n=1 Tax=Araneus ventricosus TaxID=182803 RepID=A0A4Y2SQP6_ARAVE|nr:hypothetical protein AVEN_181286-1 [Araneus ventricosus]
MAESRFKMDLSLQRIAIINFAIDLWTAPDALIVIQECRFTSVYSSTIDDWSKSEEWQKIVCLIKNKVPELKKTLKNQILESIYEIGREIVNWKAFHEEYLSDKDFSATILKKLVWTPAGTIDYLETAKIAITEGLSEILNLYQLACLNCLEEDIRKIWKKIPTDIKIRFRSNNDPIALKPDRVLVVFWNLLNLHADEAEVEGNIEITDIWSCYDICPLKMSIFKSYTPSQYGLKWAAITGNKVASEYFFQKLKSDEAGDSLLKAADLILRTRVKYRFAEAVCFPKEKYAPTLWYFLSKMSEYQLMLVFKHHAHAILRCFLDWPCQDLFIKNAEFLWKFLSFKQYSELGLVLITDASKFGYNNLQAFEHFFQHSPETLASSFIFENARTIFNEKNANVMQLMMKNVSGVIIEKFLMRGGLIYFERLINEENWSVLETFTRKCQLSEEAKTKCRADFVLHISNFFTREERQQRIPKWRHFFNLIGITC